jgi:signal transduction histidine kinase
MASLWRNRTLVFQSVLAVAAVGLVALQFRTIDRLEAAERSLKKVQAYAPVEIRPLNVERVFSFPENTCGPTPLPVFTMASTSRRIMQSATLTRLAREQFQYGLLLTGCLFMGLFLGAGLTYRTAYRESRLAHMKSAFVSNISHEMKTPLATIQMYAETLGAGRVRDPAKLAEYHKVIHEESLRLGQMIEDVLDFARMENQLYRFRFAPTDLRALVSNVCGIFERQIVHAGGQFRTAIAPDLPVVDIDGKAMSQAIANLLSNAQKYSLATLDVALEAGLSRDGVAISVSDRGVGIAPEEQERIFEKFYRAGTGLTHNTKGAGLGLAIANQIVKAHQGRITVSSEPGRGSRFTILIPWTMHGQTAETADRRG